MFIFPSKNPAKLGIIIIINYFIWGFVAGTFVVFSWLFLFIYNHLYAVIIQGAAISSLRAELTITKVRKPQYEQLIKKFEEKQSPLSTINFAALKNPFKAAAEAKTATKQP